MSATKRLVCSRRIPIPIRRADWRFTPHSKFVWVKRNLILTIEAHSCISSKARASWFKVSVYVIAATQKAKGSNNGQRIVFWVKSNRRIHPRRWTGGQHFAISRISSWWIIHKQQGSRKTYRLCSGVRDLQRERWKGRRIQEGGRGSGTITEIFWKTPSKERFDPSTWNCHCREGNVLFTFIYFLRYLIQCSLAKFHQRSWKLLYKT